MKTLHKYLLNPRRPIVSMPIGAKPLSVQMQRGDVCLWALVDPNAELQDRNFHILRTGDSVRHTPSGENWLVAYADYHTDDLAPCGWPPSLARISDCTIRRRCTDAQHEKLVREIAKGSGSDHRRCWVERKYADILAQEPSVPATGSERCLNPTQNTHS